MHFWTYRDFIPTLIVCLVKKKVWVRNHSLCWTHCSTVMWPPEVPLRSRGVLILSPVSPPSLEGCSTFFLPLVFWAVTVMCLSVALFAFIVLRTWAPSIWKFMKFLSWIIFSVISFLLFFSVFLFWNSFYANVEPSQIILWCSHLFSCYPFFGLWTLFSRKFQLYPKIFVINFFFISSIVFSISKSFLVMVVPFSKCFFFKSNSFTEIFIYNWPT